MFDLSLLLNHAGRWRGSNRLHDPNTGKPEDSESTLSIAPVLNGKFARIDYTWAYQSKPQQGSLLVGFEPQAMQVTGHLIDSWHMSTGVLPLRGAAPDGKVISLLGSYAAPPGPDWGWRIEIVVPASSNGAASDDARMALRMFNIEPDGTTEPAVEANWTRESNVGEIGQIALVASDVPKLLPFYRDVLGLAFLFGPSPQLAFLAAGDVRIMLTTPQGAGTVGANSVLYFKVHDVERVQRSIVDRGAAEEQPPHLVAKMPDHELWIGFVRDPDGNLIGLMEEKR